MPLKKGSNVSVTSHVSHPGNSYRSVDTWTPRIPPPHPQLQIFNDPLISAAACMDVNGTYICSAFNPRCFLLQKVRENAYLYTILNFHSTICLD